MNFATVEEADADPVLSAVAGWTALEQRGKELAVAQASLWLGTEFVTPSGASLAAFVAGLPGVPDLVRAATLVAIRHGLVVPLFPEPRPPVAGGAGVVTKIRQKVASLEKETTWAVPTGKEAKAVSERGEIDALLRGIAVRAERLEAAAAARHRSAPFVV